MRKVLLLSVCTISLMGCATLKNLFAPNQAISPANIAALESELTVADHAALFYLVLPQCPLNAPLCSDANTKAKIKGYENAAYLAVKKLQSDASGGTSAEMSEATTALYLLTGAIPHMAPPVPAAPK